MKNQILRSVNVDRSNKDKPIFISWGDKHSSGTLHLSIEEVEMIADIMEMAKAIRGDYGELKS